MIAKETVAEIAVALKEIRKLMRFSTSLENSSRGTSTVSDVPGIAELEKGNIPFLVETQSSPEAI